MAKRQKPKAERDRIARWEQLVSCYQRRHRQWVMETMPTMSDTDWKGYEKWVAGFGAMTAGQAVVRNSRRMRRRMRALRTAKKRKDTVAVTRPTLLMSTVFARMRFAVGLSEVVRVNGKVATPQGATRR